MRPPLYSVSFNALIMLLYSTARQPGLFSTIELVNALGDGEVRWQTGVDRKPDDVYRSGDPGRTGYLPSSQVGGALLFHFIGKLYGRTSPVITTNPSFAK